MTADAHSARMSTTALLLRMSFYCRKGHVINGATAKLHKFQWSQRTQRHRYSLALAAVAAAYPANVRMAHGVGRVRFAPEHLSAHDFYHPSAKGQAMLAERTWLEGWF